MAKYDTNCIPVGATGCIKGKLAFSAYLTRLCEGEALDKFIQQQKTQKRKYPTTDPCIRFTLEDVEVVCKDPKKPTEMDKYLHSKIFTREDGVTTFGVERKAKNVPRFGHINSKGTIDDVSDQIRGRSLANGQEVMVWFECFSTDKGNNGVSVQSVVFPNIPQFYDPLSRLAGGKWNSVPEEPLENVPDATDVAVEEDTVPEPVAPETAQEEEPQFAPMAPDDEDENPWA